ncbi:hypothetical protein F4859DRAFT_304170 [Xylaria cf. heliscus]|nr:hypothetical protein F4859DRAFT_304170 [Xylaria cf. heliscus]
MKSRRWPIGTCEWAFTSIIISHGIQQVYLPYLPRKLQTVDPKLQTTPVLCPLVICCIMYATIEAASDRNVTTRTRQLNACVLVCWSQSHEMLPIILCKPT